MDPNTKIMLMAINPDTGRGEYHTVLRSKLPEFGIFNRMIKSKSTIVGDGSIVMVEFDDYNVLKVAEYIQNPGIIVSDKEYAELLSYYGVYYMNNYYEIYARELFFKENMYKSGFETHEVNTDLYYNLIKYSELENVPFVKSWSDDCLFVDLQKNISGFKYNPGLIYHPDYGEFKNNLEFITKYNQDTIPHLFIAGGYIFKHLGNLYINGDIDVFFVGCDEENANNLIDIFIINNQRNIRKITRSTNCVSVFMSHNYNIIEVQFILRLYRSYSEVLHGFDVDCCCVGYDGNDIYMTERALYAISNRTNTVNFDLLSPSYEYRLVKYAHRGFVVRVTNLDKFNIFDENVEIVYKATYGLHNMKQRVGKLYSLIWENNKLGYDVKEIEDDLAEMKIEICNL